MSEIKNVRLYLKSMGDLYEKLSPKGLIPPQAVDLEESLLGASLIDKSSANRVITILGEREMTDSPFYRDAHTLIYMAMVKLFGRGEPVDLLTVKTELASNGTLEEIGGPAYLVELTSKVVTTVNVESYARIILEKYMARELIRVCEEMKLRAFEGELDTFQMLEETTDYLLHLSAGKAASSPRKISEAAPRVLRAIEKVAQGEPPGVPFGFPEIDKLTQGLGFGSQTVLAGGPGDGKAQPLDAKVLTPYGWRAMGELRVGDELLAPDGRIIHVAAVHPRGVRQVYRITFSDGRSTECCKDHLWSVRSHKWNAVRVLSISEILNRSKHSLRHIKIDLPSGEWGNKIGGIDPWLLGYLLGNGCMKDSHSLSVSTKDGDVLKRIEGLLPAPFRLVQGSNPFDYSIRGPRTGGELKNPIKSELMALGLWNLGSPEKFIPEMYFHADRHTRLELLRGLLDSDGWVEKTADIRFQSASEQLSLGVQRLARSLGHMARIRRRGNVFFTYKGERRKGLDAYLCSITCVKDGGDLFWLKRKKERVGECRRFGVNLLIKSIVPSRVCDTRCITVDDPAGLYITDDYIITHNSALASYVALKTAERGQGVVIFSSEMKDIEIYYRFLAAGTGISQSSIRGGLKRPYDPDREDREWREVSKEMMRIASFPLWIDDTPGLTPLQIRSRLKLVMARNPVSLVVVDYLQLLRPTQKTQNREREVASISSDLKILWSETNVAGLVLSQLNRPEVKYDKNGNPLPLPRPVLSRLRESGSLEQDAHDVYFIYHPLAHEFGYKDRDKVTVELIREKARAGRPGTCELIFDRPHLKYEEPAPRLPEFHDPEGEAF